MIISPRLTGKAAVVTGAGRGIGRAIAVRLGQEGADVAVVDIHAQSAEETASAIRALGRRSVVLTVDLSRVEQIRVMIDQVVEAFGRVDILVNNAGRVEIKPFLDVTEAEWDQTLDLNLKGTYFCLQAAARQMVKQGGGGRIVNMSSVSGRGGRADSSAYAASKMGIISVTRSAALALAQHGIRVNAVCPGIVPTPMWDKIDEDRARLFGYQAGTARAQLVEKVPLKRVAEAEEIAAAVAFLASDDSSFVTGQALNVDGGLEMD
ncbi:MAG: SDR family oxidoreductase [candidate division Zixibacteria bacterium]|nr:SDR family oxidoreductase [candidate division Zixibacteria bacterium]